MRTIRAHMDPLRTSHRGAVLPDPHLSDSNLLCSSNNSGYTEPSNLPQSHASSLDPCNSHIMIVVFMNMIPLYS